MDLRKFINLTEGLLTESRGLVGRKAGDEFTNKDGLKLYFEEITFFPDGGGQFDDQEELLSVITTVEDEINDVIRWTNKPTARSKGFGVAKFVKRDEETGEELESVYYGKYFDKINPNFMENNFPNTVDGYSLNTGSAKKTKSGLMVQDILTSFENLTPRDIVNQVAAKFGDPHPITSAAYSVAAGQDLPIYIPANGINFTGFRDYFAEILQPLMLVSGNTGNRTGNAEEAEKIFFGKNGFETATISFSTGKNTGLYDSLLTNRDGKVIKISSKAGAGATASVSNLYDAIVEIKKAAPKLAEKYEDTIEICEIAKDAGQHGAPIELAKKFGLISSAEAESIYALRKSSSTKLTTKLQKMLAAWTVKDKEKSTAYYTLLASLAKAVEDYVNVYTKFSEEAADILNNSALIQVYSDIRLSGDQIIINTFDIKYPASTITNVLFSASKTYYSTGIKGNFTFKIDRKGSKTTQNISAPVPDDLETRVNVRPKGTKTSPEQSGPRKRR